MARTAPVPDIPPIPGMCPSVAVLAGGGDAGGSGGKGTGSGDGSAGAGTGTGGEHAESDGKGAPDPSKCAESAAVSDPVDVVTGRAFTHPIEILDLLGPLPLRWTRAYSSAMADRDVGIGYGWAHSLGWEIEAGRRTLSVWTDQGTEVVFPHIPVGEWRIGKWGWLLRREAWGFVLDSGDGVRRVFSFVQQGGKRACLTALEDRNRNRISLTYDDASGRLIEVNDSAGRVIRAVAGRTGRIASIEAKNAASQGRWIAFETYTYDNAGNLVAATDADGFSSSYQYNEDHLLTANTDRTGLTFHFVYDQQCRCIEAWGDYSGKPDPSLVADLPQTLHDGTTPCKGIHHCRINYYQGGWTEVIDSTQARDFFGNRHGTLDKSVIGGAVTTAAYRDDGMIIARTDPMHGTEIFGRNERGNIIQYTDQLGRVTSLQRDAYELPIELIDPKGGLHRIERDCRGNPTLYVDPTGAATSFRHDERGLWSERVSPSGERTTYEHDAHGDLVRKTLPTGQAWRYTYDFLGRLRSEVDPLGAETRYMWSDRGDLVSIHDAAGGVTQLAYDGERHLTRVVDPNGGITAFTWGGYHKVCMIRNANGHDVRLVYNVEGELIMVRNEKGEEHHLDRNPSGKLIEERTFDERTVHYRRDWAGRVIRQTNADGSRTTFTHDLAGQVTQIELRDGTIQTFDYDLLGDLISAAWPGGELQFERDALGRVVRETLMFGGEEHVVEIAHNAEGDRTRRSTSLGHVEAIERGLLGARRRTVLDGKHLIEHQADVLGREIARVLPGGGRIESAFDVMGRIERRRAVGPAVARTVGPGEPAWVRPSAENSTVETAYRYAPAGELIAALDQQRGQTAYQYDPIGRLLARMPEQARSELFRYDPAGNIHENGAGAEPREYGKGNRLIRKGHTEYRWDGDGRLSEKRINNLAMGKIDIWKYRWNGASLLESVTTPTGELYEYAYDPFGRRIEKRVGRAGLLGQPKATASVTRFVWDGDVLVHEITKKAQAAGDLVEEVKTYCFEDDRFEPVAHRDAGGWFHYVNDPIGTPERLVDGRGKVACELQRDAWGRTEAAPGGKTKTSFRFQGQYEDAETGLCYNRFRYYEPETGRFISADPIGLDGGMNQFVAPKNFQSWIDPLGLEGGTPRDAQRAIRRGQGPSQILRIDAPEQSVPGSQWHAHQRDCVKGKYPALNLDGSSHDGTPNFSKKTRAWLRSYGWNA